MDAYTILWPNNYWKLLQKCKDIGPLSTIYGGPHISQPSLGKVNVGDIIFPVRVEKGNLYILGRMTVKEKHDAKLYIKNELGINAPNMWDIYHTELLKINPSLGHCVPRTCADHVVIGEDGTMLVDRQFPVHMVSSLLFGTKAGEEKPLSNILDSGLLKNHVSLQGHFRRLSSDSARILIDFISLTK